MTVVITAATTVTVAVLGFLFTYIHSRRLQERNDRLARVNRQLAELYGPAFSLSESSRIAFDAFCARYGDVRKIKDEQDRLSTVQRDAWQTWMTTVFQPANKRIFEILMTKADLLVDDTMPSCISEFCAHVLSYEVVIADWAAGSDDLFAAIDYPSSFTSYIKGCYMRLKGRQAALLADDKSRWPRYESAKSVEWWPPLLRRRHSYANILMNTEKISARTDPDDLA